MKTLAVLSALATIALAAPALEETSLTPTDLTSTQQREKKSTLEEIVSEKSLDHFEDHASPEIPNKFARTFSGFKKPIIVKKKIGYSVYRNSDEEQAQADSRESCKNQIRVKLCDDINTIDKMKSASIHHTNAESMSEREMKHSIDLAKEAVETFQRDLRKMGHDSAESNGHRHAPLGTDEELRDDIERARQALEHIQRKFKNLDTVTSLSNDGTSDVHLNTMKSDEERLALWKDTMNDLKHVETGRNFEENLKDINKMATLEDMKSGSSTEKHLNSISAKEVNGQDTLKLKETETDDNIKTIVEEKSPKMEIHSDSLKKGKSMIEKDHKKEKIFEDKERNVEEKMDFLENAKEKLKVSEFKKSTECNDKEHENIHHVQGNLERHVNDQEPLQLESSDIKMQEKDIKDGLDKLESKSSIDSAEPAKVNQAQINVENERSMKQEDHKIHESLDSPNEEAEETKTILSKQSFEEPKTSLSQEVMREEVDDKQDLHHTQRLTQMESLIMPEKQTIEKLHSSFKNDMEPQGSSATLTKLDDSKSNFKNNMHEHDGDGKTNDHKIIAPSRAASDFHKEILNNMDFTEDLHQSSLNKQSPSKTSHLLKHEKSEFHERLNVPQMQPNAGHIENTMHLSDATQDNTNQRAQTKMATMFHNEQPNLNVQFNNPQTFEEQTNVQNLMPFKSATEFHDEHLHKMNSNHDLEIPSDLQDPLQIRWAHENHLDKLKAASQFHGDNMEMDGSSPHISIDRSMPLRSNLMDGHMNFNEQLSDHQRWGQGKNVNAYKSVPLSTGMSTQNFHGNERKTDHFGQLHDHETLLSRNNDHVMMMHGKSNMDSAVQSMRMRGPSKMALEYAGPNQWNHNHGTFRSSYGPASYGVGGGSATTSGGSAVGVFPNANVGNYAVPLLLSCSPSVVSGSLAKTNSYNAPSYRSSDINFVKKRDTDKFEGNTGLKVQGHVSGQKPNTILVTKL